MLCDVTKTILTLLLGGSGALALFFGAYQLALRRRAHLLELYRQAFAIMDGADVREARRFVYQLDPQAHKKEHWLELDNYKMDPSYPVWRENLGRAERVARPFDQLGLLVREGLLPVNIVARFYASPALRCWHKLSPYINADRSPASRNQPGHMWEWEHLIFEVIIPSLKEGKSTWRGVSAHDKLEDLIHKVEHEHQSMIKDSEYNPPSMLWELGRWYELWKW
jgi:hypothetical protein